MSKFIWYPGSRRVVTFTPDLALDVSPFPVPEAPEVIEARRLASELLRGKAASAAVMKTLQNAVDLRPHKPGALLRRLRESKCRGYLFDHEDMLAGLIYDLHWI